MALENVGSFQYLMYKDIRETNSDTEEQLKGHQLFNARGWNGPWNFWLISTLGNHSKTIVNLY